MNPSPSTRDLEQLSAYLDGQLKPSESARIESRLQTEPELATVLKELRQTRAILRQIPQRRAPRNFTLTPKMVGSKPPMPRTYPIFRFASALATVLLFVTIATNFIGPRYSGKSEPFLFTRNDVEAPAEAMAEAESMEAAATEAPMAAPEAMATEVMAEEAMATEAMALAGAQGQASDDFQSAQESGTTILPAPAVEDSTRIVSTPQPVEKSLFDEDATGQTLTEEGVPELAPEDMQETQPQPKIRAIWQVTLAGIAFFSGLIALILRSTAIRKWRKIVK